MIKRNIEALTIYSIEKEMEAIPFECLRKLYLEKTSEIVYITKNQKLYGIIGMGEALHPLQNGEIKINKTFTALVGYNNIEAYKIFRKRSQVQKIPVVNEMGELLGDYSRWDDALYIERNQEQLMQEDVVKKVLNQYETVYVVEPIEYQNSNYLCLISYLNRFHICYALLTKEKIVDKLSENAICIFLDEDERRGVQCLYGLKPSVYDNRGYNTFRYDILADERWKIRLATYRNLLLQIMKETCLNELGIKKPDNLLYDRLDDKATVLLSALIKNGVGSFCIYNNENEESNYGKTFMNEVRERLKVYPWNLEEPWAKANGNEEFYGELNQLEDYERGTAQKELFFLDGQLGYKKDISGKFFNAKDGRRVTCYQPVEYVGTIYIIGLCTVVGGYVEDKYTFASWLQKKLLERGYDYRVENYGAEMLFDVENRLQEIGEYNVNDLVIYHSWIGEAVNINGLSLEKIYESNNMPSTWVIDGFGHVNHKANQLIADGLFRMIEPNLSKQTTEKNNIGKIKINFHDIMKNYVQQKFLKQYFQGVFNKEYSTIGAIVMQGGYFHKGHRYLIEQAKCQVDFLIIFVLEEDMLLIPFEERFKLIKEGVQDLEDIMLVPNGDFVLSRNNFYEFYTQKYDIRTSLNAEYDINVYADYIAEPLHITHRFAGANPKGRIKKVYNETMRRILPQKGISFVEIPKMMIEGEDISTLQVQKHLEDEEYDKAFALVPESTKQYLMEQLNLTDKDIKNRGVMAK